MICDKCNTAMKIERAGFKVTGDTSPTETTELFQVPIFMCVNEICTEFGKEHTGKPRPVTLGE